MVAGKFSSSLLRFVNHPTKGLAQWSSTGGNLPPSPEGTWWCPETSLVVISGWGLLQAPSVWRPETPKILQCAGQSHRKELSVPKCKQLKELGDHTVQPHTGRLKGFLERRGQLGLGFI